MTFPLNKWPRVGTMLAVWAIGSAALCSTSIAQTSKEYALMGTKAYKAFRCSALASFAGNKDEQHRLFQLGYEDGKTFIEARRNGKIEGADLSQVPTGILVDIEGPTADFSLGRLSCLGAVGRMSTFEDGPSEAALRDLRQPSPFPADEGELIGKKKTPGKCLRRFLPCTTGRKIR
jgi:hypothetical protein